MEAEVDNVCGVYKKETNGTCVHYSNDTKKYISELNKRTKEKNRRHSIIYKKTDSYSNYTN